MGVFFGYFIYLVGEVIKECELKRKKKKIFSVFLIFSYV